MLQFFFLIFKWVNINRLLWSTRLIISVCNIILYTYHVHALTWNIPVSLWDLMARCSRAVDGEWLEHMLKATTATHWGSPSWETSTVPWLVAALLLMLSSEHFCHRANNMSDCRSRPELGGSDLSPEAAAVRGLSGLPTARVCTAGPQRPEQDRMSRGQTLRRPPKTKTVSPVREAVILAACGRNYWQGTSSCYLGNKEHFSVSLRRMSFVEKTIKIFKKIIIFNQSLHW